MAHYSDAAMLRGDYAKLIKQMPKSSEWQKAACDNKAEAVAQEVAKQIFAMQQNIDPESESLEVFTYSSKGPMKVLNILPGDGDLIRISGVLPDKKATPVFMIQHAHQLSLTFMKADLKKKKAEEDDGMQIGFVIFDELKKRKKDRAAAKKRKTPASGKPTGSRSTKQIEK